MISGKLKINKNIILNRRKKKNYLVSNSGKPESNLNNGKVYHRPVKRFDQHMIRRCCYSMSEVGRRKNQSRQFQKHQLKQ